MPISLRCPCGKSLRAPDTAVGKKVRCPGCQASLTVPASTGPRPAPSAPARNRPADPGAKPAAKGGRKVLGILLGCLGAGVAGCLVCTGVVGLLAFLGSGKSVADRLVGKWVVDVEASRQMRPDFRNSMDFFLAFNKDGTVSYGTPGQEYNRSWEVKGETPQGTEIWFRDPKVSEMYIVKVKFLDDDHLEVRQSAYVSDCRMKRAGTPDTPRPPGDTRPAGGAGPVARKGPRPGEPIDLQAHNGRVTSLSQTMTGELVTGGTDGVIKVWDPATWTVKKQYVVTKKEDLKPSDILTGLAAVPNREIAIFTASSGEGVGNGRIRQWRWSQPGPAEGFSLARRAPHAVTVSADGNLAAWDDEDWVVVWDLTTIGTGKTFSDKVHFTGLLPGVRALSFDHDATQVVTVGSEGVQVWSLAPNAKPASVTLKIPNAVCAVLTRPNTLLVGTSDGKAVVWDVTRNQAGKEFPLPGPARAAVLCQNNRRVAISTPQAVSVFWNEAAVELYGSVSMPPGHVTTRIALDTGGHRLATAGEDTDGKVWVWDILELKR
jgi:hypothetical protein